MAALGPRAERHGGGCVMGIPDTELSAVVPTGDAVPALAARRGASGGGLLIERPFARGAVTA